MRVIVMLTAESEGGQLKCHPYWKERDYGPIKLKPLSEKKASLDIDKHMSQSPPAMSSTGGVGGETVRRRANTLTSVASSTPTSQATSTSNQGETPYVIVRKFALSHAAHPFAPMREITHLHFPSWPDFGTPAQPSHLLALVELANVMQRTSMPVATASIVGKSGDQAPIKWYDEPESDVRARPMLVHCSAGCGRTGTFCAVDSTIDMLKRQRLEKSSLKRPRDSEGDMAMHDSNEDVSPKTTTATLDEAFGVGSEAGERQQRRGSSPADTSWLRDDKVDLIQKAVEEFRQERISMVQSLRQFVLCYETVLEWVHRMNEGGGGANFLSGRGRCNSLVEPRRE